ncbi:MAG: hypothetical protein ACRDGP_07435 [Actinomycetota bacterium]
MKVEIRDHSGIVGTVTLKDGVAVADASAIAFLEDLTVVEPGNPRPKLRPSDGKDYLEALPYALRGTYLWATAPME